MNHKCKLCGGMKLDWQVFCGTSCAARWEGGQRPIEPIDAESQEALDESTYGPTVAECQAWAVNYVDPKEEE